MNYIDIELSLSSFKNYQILEIPKIITNYVIRNPDEHTIFKNKYKNIEELLSHIHRKFDRLKNYTEDNLLKIILEYFGIANKTENV